MKALARQPFEIQRLIIFIRMRSSDAPTWANVTFKGMVVGANGFARKNEFVEGSADDGDVFMALLRTLMGILFVT